MFERGSVPPQWTYFANLAEPQPTQPTTDEIFEPLGWPIASKTGDLYFQATAYGQDIYLHGTIGVINTSGTDNFAEVYGGQSSPTDNRLVKATDGTFWLIGGGGQDRGFVTGFTDDGTVNPPFLAGYDPDNEYVLDIAANNMNDVWFTVCCGGHYIVHGTSPFTRTKNTDTAKFYRIPDQADRVQNVVIGPDKNIWVTIQHHTTGVWVLAKLVPSTSVVTEYALPSTATASPAELFVGPDKNIWLVEGSYAYRITTAASIASFKLPVAANGYIAIGPDDDLWLTGSSTHPTLMRMTTAGKVLNTYTCPSSICSSGGAATGVTTGPDKDVWFTTASGMGAYVWQSIDPVPSTLTFTATGQTHTITVTESNYSGTWTASSTATSVAQVVKGTKAGTFVVTAAGKGSARIIVRDTDNNYYGVSVTVE